MRREVEMEVRLPAFDLSISELELLWNRMRELFDAETPLRTSLKLTLPGEKLQFSDLNELKEYGRVRGRVREFELEFSQANRSVRLRSAGLFFRPNPTARAEAETDVWCAGAINAVRSVIQLNRAWYWWFLNMPFMLFFFVLSLLPLASSWLGLEIFKEMSGKVALAWFSIVGLLGFLSFTKDKLLPASVITFTQEPNFVRRYGAEISLVLGVISIVLAIMALV